jgi:hypothetical protein
MPIKTFKTKLLQADDSAACAVELPFNPKDAFGKVRAPVKATINGHSFRTTTCHMGGMFLFPVNKANREAAGIAAGDTIRVKLEPDAAPRVVTPPPDLLRELKKNKTVYAAWKKLSYTHQREHVQAIEQAKKPETRARRIAAALAMLRPR